MKFLADAHISVEMIAMIRDQGHDYLDSSAIPARMPDLEVLQMAAAQQRVMVTSDKDFGELVFVHRIACPGVILIRIGLAEEVDRIAHMRLVFPVVLSRLPGSMITVTVSGGRARPIP
ncbi:MAG TPA: DUF5615 family PIN-like protein [Tepidisphaeraceae bacterium]|nr:DUF5615 family PIN-like protein [Tepidisphaeraceae bacterium]